MITLSREQLEGHFDRSAFRSTHALSTHPLLDAARVRTLLETLSPSRCEYQSGRAPESMPDPSTTPRTGLGLLETFDRLGEVSSWVAIKNVETDPDYAKLLAETLHSLQALEFAGLAKMLNLEAFIFASSPGAVTPYHMDPEQNFLLQIRGSKTLWVLDPNDRELLPSQEIEGFYTQGQRNRAMPPQAKQRATAFRLQPGDALYIPPLSPHWVEVSSEQPSLSLSLTFRSPESNRRERLHRTNARLRALGWTPRPVGAHPRHDVVKDTVLRVPRLCGRGAASVRRSLARSTPN